MVRSRLFACLLSVALTLVLFSCPPAAAGDSDDGVVIPSGTKISDFSGHRNSLNWLLGTFSDDNGAFDKWVFADTTVTQGTKFPGEGWTDTVYNISSIAYHEQATMVGSYNAPIGSWAFTLSHNDDNIVYIIEKESNNGFYLTHSSFDTRPAAVRRRLN